MPNKNKNYTGLFYLLQMIQSLLYSLLRQVKVFFNGCLGDWGPGAGNENLRLPFSVMIDFYTVWLFVEIPIGI